MRRPQPGTCPAPAAPAWDCPPATLHACCPLPPRFWPLTERSGCPAAACRSLAMRPWPPTVCEGCLAAACSPSAGRIWPLARPGCPAAACRTCRRASCQPSQRRCWRGGGRQPTHAGRHHLRPSFRWWGTSAVKASSPSPAVAVSAAQAGGRTRAARAAVRLQHLRIQESRVRRRTSAASVWIYWNKA